jgi:hypothetical protein
MKFFTSPADLRAWFLLVEAAQPLHFARIGAFSYPDTPVYPSITAAPDLDRPGVCYYLTTPGTQPARKQPYLARGGPWWYVDRDSEENKRFPILKPSVCEEPGVLGEGFTWCDDDYPENGPLGLLLEQEGERTLLRFRDWYIGPEALTWLQAGTVRFAEEDGDGKPRKTPRLFHPCRVGNKLFKVGKIDSVWRSADVQHLAR